MIKTPLLLLACLAGLAPGLLSAKEGAVECGNLIYAGTKTSRCFSDEFLSTVQQSVDRQYQVCPAADAQIVHVNPGGFKHAKLFKQSARIDDRTST